jgi:TPP-dependent pyruvate/acetoin dehydrogenase alpha subunit
MLQTAARADARLEDLKGRYLATYRWMLLARVLEEKLASLYRGGKITGGVFLGRGQEALSASLGTALRKGDIFAPLIRDMAGRLAFGEAPWMPCAPTSAPGWARCAGGMATSIGGSRKMATTR